MSKLKTHQSDLELRDIFSRGKQITLNLGEGEKDYRIIKAEPEGLSVLTEGGLVEIPNGDPRIVMEK